MKKGHLRTKIGKIIKISDNLCEPDEATNNEQLKAVGKIVWE